MQKLHLDSHQAKVFHEFEKHERILVRGAKNTGKSHLLRTICAAQLLKEKKVLYAVKDRQTMLESIRKMQMFSLKNECLALIPGSKLDAESLNRLRHSLKAESTKIDEKQRQKILAKKRVLTERINSFYTKINQDSLFEKKWHELVILQAFNKNSFQTLHFNQIIQTDHFDFSKEEYASLYDQVMTASEFNQQGRVFTETLFTGKNYEGDSKEDAWQYINNWIQEATKRITHLIQSIIVYLNEETASRTKVFIHKVHKLNESTNDLLSQMQGSEIDDEFIDSYLELTKNINECKEYVQYFGRLNALPSPLQKEELKSKLDRIRTNFNQLNGPLQNQISRQISGISINETSAPSLAKIDRELNDCYTWLNQQELFNRRFERTALSINKQLSQLEQMLLFLKEWKSLGPRFQYYFEWNKFIRSLEEKTKHLLGKMSVFQPKDWTHFFRNWFIQNHINRINDPFGHDIEWEIEELLRVEKIFEEVELDTYLHEKSENRQHHLKVLKDKDRGLHRELIRKSNPLDLTFDALLSNHFDLLSHVFPLQFISFEELEKIEKSSGSSWDLLIIDGDEWIKDIKEMKVDLLTLAQKTIFADTGGQFFTNYCKEKDSLPVIFDLHGYQLQNIIDLKEMVQTERLYAARHLAHLLQDVNHHLSIYHVGKSIIYSAMSGPLNLVFEKLMENRGIKKIRVLEKQFHTLVENILEIDGPQKLITQDHLLNNGEIQTLFWQLQVMQKAKRAGLEIININTKDLLEEALPTLLAFISEHFPINDPT